MVSSPVLIAVLVIFKFFNPPTLTLGIKLLRFKPRAVETATAETIRTTREAQDIVTSEGDRRDNSPASNPSRSLCGSGSFTHPEWVTMQPPLLEKL